MATLIVRAKRLNKRSVIPAFLPDPNNIVAVVNENFVFEGEEVRATETPNPALGTWYKDRDGHFYWGGALQRFAEPTATLTGATNYQTQFPGIPRDWLMTGGKNIKVAVLDTGFFLDHVDLRHLNPASVLDFGGNNNTLDKEGHGTHVLGLMGAQSGADGVTGLIPQAQFFLYKVVLDDVGFLDFAAADAVLDAIQKGVDIISMSFSVSSANNSPFHNAINRAVNNKILVVASAGENDNLVQSGLVAPARFEGVVSVGEVSRNFSQALNIAFNDQLDFIMPFVPQKSCWINNSVGLYHDLAGSSMATAFVTGILTSILSASNRNVDAVNELKTIATSFSNTVFNDSILKIVKP